MRPDIAMDWDGKEPVAKLIVEGVSLTGLPAEVERVFDELNYLRSRCLAAESRLNRVRAAVRKLEHS